MKELFKTNLLVKSIIVAFVLSISSCGNFTFNNNGTSKVATPTFDVAAGSFDVNQEVNISCATSGATIHYTTDGSTPTASSNAYSSSISVSGANVHISSAIAVSGDETALTIKAIAVKDDMEDSDVASATYNINYDQLEVPVLSPASGSFSTDTAVTISGPDGADIYYTTDGSEPTAASTLYTVPISVSGNGTDVTIKAIAIQDQKLDSTVASEEYIINYDKVSTPQISPTAGTYSSGQSITITCSTDGAAIYYTTNGSTPDGSSTLYDANSKPTITSAITLKAKAFKAGYTDSDTASTSYTISPMVSHFVGSLGGSGYDDGFGSAASFYSPGEVTSDGTNLYVVDSSNHTIRKIVIATGEVTTFAGTISSSGSTDGIGTSAKFNYPRGITTDGTNLYVTDTSNQTIRKIVIATAEVTTLAGTVGSSGSTNGTGTSAKFNTPYGITNDGTNLYVVDEMNYTIRKIVIATAEVTTFAGTVGSNGSTDGTGTSAKFKYSLGITRDGANLYVADQGNHTIRKIVIATAEVTTLAGTAGSSGTTNDVGAAARFNSPMCITSDGTNLYVGDDSNRTIRKIVIATAAVTTFAGTAGSSGSTDGIGSAARFSTTHGITNDGTNLYVADSSNNSIRKIVIATAAVTTFAGAAAESGTTDGIGSAARFNGLGGMTSDGTNLYVVVSGSHTIRKIVIATGEVTTFAGTAGSSGSTDGIGTSAKFNCPRGITTDGANLYVADSTNYTIRKIVIATAEVTTLAGSAGLAGDTDGTGATARFNNPYDITTDGTNLYVLEYVRCTIRKIVIATGEVTTFAGTSGSSGSTNGIGAAARFSYPKSITSDGTNLYVGDDSNKTIRKIVIATATVSTLAGTTGVSGSTNGIGTAAKFKDLMSITNDGTNLYVTDYNNWTIRKIVIATGEVTTFAGTTGRGGRTDGTLTNASFTPYFIYYVGGKLFIGEYTNDIRKIDGI